MHTIDEPAANTNRGIRLIDMVVVIGALALLAMFAAPWLLDSDSEKNRLRCMNHAKQIALAIQNFEITNKTLPLASTRMITAKPGHFGDADAAGFSWLVQIAPYLDEGATWPNMSRATNKFAKDLYDPAVTSADGSDGLP